MLELAADNLFGRQAENQAALALEKGRVEGGKTHASSVLKIAPSKPIDQSGKSHERAAKLAKQAGIRFPKPAAGDLSPSASPNLLSGPPPGL
jgi:hypothetical protein